MLRVQAAALKFGGAIGTRPAPVPTRRKHHFPYSPGASDSITSKTPSAVTNHSGSLEPGIFACTSRQRKQDPDRIDGVQGNNARSQPGRSAGFT